MDEKSKREINDLTLDEMLVLWTSGKCPNTTFYAYLETNLKATAEFFRRVYITDKDGILTALDKQKEIWVGVREDGCVHTSQYFEHLFPMLERFREQVEDVCLIEPLPDWWAYSIDVNTSGISLHLDYYNDDDSRPYLPLQSAEDPQIGANQSFELLKEESRFLKVEEFSTSFGVEPPAVRAWIRRGKIPSAIKYGREWRIPELCDVGGSSYARRHYFWQMELSDIPEEYQFLNNYRGVILQRNQRNNKLYEADFYGGESRKIDVKAIDIKERERLEMILISNPMVYLKEPPFAHITQRKGQGVYLEPFDGADDNKFLRKFDLESLKNSLKNEGGSMNGEI